MLGPADGPLLVFLLFAVIYTTRARALHMTQQQSAAKRTPAVLLLLLCMLLCAVCHPPSSGALLVSLSFELRTWAKYNSFRRVNYTITHRG